MWLWDALKEFVDTTSVGLRSLSFGAKSRLTAESVSEGVNLTGKTAIVTGGNAGIGAETARVLAMRGCHVILACRDATRAAAAAQQMTGHVEPMDLDLASLASVRAFAQAFKAKHSSLHLLILNAGLMAPQERMETADGFEVQLGTNHLGHFLLVQLLLDVLQSSAPARVISVSSEGHRLGKLDFDDMNWEHSYKRWYAYGRSKLANILLARELQRRYGDKGITAVSLHPGAINTQLTRYMTPYEQSMMSSMSRFMLKTVPQGAATSVFLATAPSEQVVGGAYYCDCQLATPTQDALNDKDAERFWEWSLHAVKL
jgi:NAD(P)-dependent dehydrogenase (short-subunit alcohol dehydrogenase family)